MALVSTPATEGVLTPSAANIAVLTADNPLGVATTYSSFTYGYGLYGGTGIDSSTGVLTSSPFTEGVLTSSASARGVLV